METAAEPGPEPLEAPFPAPAFAPVPVLAFAGSSLAPQAPSAPDFAQTYELTGNYRGTSELSGKKGTP